MEPNKQGKSNFHTNQGRWDRRDFLDENRYNAQEEPSDHNYFDDELEVVVKELLHTSKTLDASDISVTAHQGSVTLSGTVKSDQQKESASAILELLHGVGVIKNDLIVKINEGILPTDVGRDA